jgi:hypothetical protein
MDSRLGTRCTTGLPEADYDDLECVLAACAEWRGEVRRAWELGLISQTLLKEAGLWPLEQPAPSQQPRRKEVHSVSEVYARVESLRLHPWVQRANWVWLLNPQQPFECLPLTPAGAKEWQQRGWHQTGELTHRPECLEPEREALRGLVLRCGNGLAQDPLAAGTALFPLAGPSGATGLGTSEVEQLAACRAALWRKVATRGTPWELWNLGVWQPHDPWPLFSELVLQRVSEPPADAPALPWQNALRRLFGERDDGLIRRLDRRAALEFGFRGGLYWWRPGNEKRQREIDPRRLEAVRAVLETLPGAVVRNGGRWVAKVRREREQGATGRNWRGCLLAHADGEMNRHIEELRAQQLPLESTWLGLQGAASAHGTGDQDEPLGMENLAARGAAHSAAARQLAWLALQAVKSLTREEHTVLALRTVVSGEGKLSREEVARLTELTAAQVANREQGALAKLQHASLGVDWDQEETAPDETDD